MQKTCAVERSSAAARSESGLSSMRWQHLVRSASGALVAAGWGVAAHADPLTVSTAVTTPVATATAANNSAGDVTIAAGGSVTVASGAAITINSPNIVTNAGAISNTGTTSAIGVLITGPGPINFINNATLTLAGTAGGGNIGLSLTGAGTSGTISASTAGSIAVAGDNAYGVLIAAPFTGAISLRSVTVSGATSTAIALTAPLTGSLSFGGTTTAATAGSTGVLVAAPVSGSVSNEGSISVGSARGISTTTGLIAAGATGIAGIRISAGVGGGFLNDRYYIDATGAVVPPASVDTTVDTLVTGTVIATGTAPALWVAPATNQAVTLGAFGTGADAYAIDNRGVLETTVADVSLPAVAVRIGGGGATTTLTGGIANQSTGSIVANSLDAPATAIDLLSGAVVPQLVNAGSIGAATTAVAATGSTAAGPGGSAFGVVVESGASLPNIVNSGSITAVSVGAGNNATAILDLSNSVTSITNTGTIAATIAPATTGSARAIDLSAGAAAVTLTNSGTIIGGIYLGGGPTAVVLTGGTVTGPIVYGISPSNSLALSGTGSFTGTLTTLTPIAVTLADTSRLSLVAGPPTLASIAATGASVLVVPVTPGVPALTVNGAASFTGTSSIALSLQSLALTQNITVVTAAGGVATDHLATLIDASSAPYLFTATAPVLTPTALTIGLARKTAAQVGLTGGQASLFDASIGALASSPTESSAIANLPNQAAVIAAYRQITPPSFGRAQLRTAQYIADTGFGAAADRLALITDRGRSKPQDGDYGIGIWAQQYGDFNRQAAGANEGTFTTSTFGIAGGIDTTRFAHTVIGIGFVSNFATIHHDAVATEGGFNVPSTTSGVEPYVAFAFKPFFLEATALYAHVGYSANRTLSIGGITDTVISNWSGTQLGAGVNVGARFNLGRFIRLTPSNALSWTRLQQDAYTEQGGGAFSLAVAKQTDSVTSDTAKLALALLHPMGDGLLKFEIHGSYTHQFNLAPTGTVVSFVTGSSAISLPGDTVRSDEHSYGADLGYTQDTIAFRGGYDRREASGFRDQSVAVSATIGF